MKEIFRKVKLPYFKHYQISNYGLLYNTRTGIYTHGSNITNSSSLQFSLYNKNIQRKIMAHKLVLLHFKKKELGKEYGLHLDKNRTNNKATNLEWATLGDLKRHYNTGKIRGIYKWNYADKDSSRKFRVYVSINKKKSKFIGYYPTYNEAVLGYQAAYLNIHGYLPF